MTSALAEESKGQKLIRSEIPSLRAHFPHYRKHVKLRRPKGESFSVRLTVRIFVLLQKLGLARCFAKLWSKISK